MKNLKAITPVISIIILLLIAVALAGAAYTFLGGYLGAYTEKSFTIPPGEGIFCTGGKITVLITNTGTTTLKKEDFKVVNIDGEDKISGLGDVSIAPGDSAIVLNIEDDSYTSGTTHTVTIGTAAGVVSRSVICT